MAIVQVRMYATVREASGKEEMRLSASNMSDLLKALAESGSENLRRLLRTSGSSDGSIVILLNGRNLTASNFSSVVLSDGDEIAIFPPVSGG